MKIIRHIPHRNFLLFTAVLATSAGWLLLPQLGKISAADTQIDSAPPIPAETGAAAPPIQTAPSPFQSEPAPATKRFSTTPPVPEARLPVTPIADAPVADAMNSDVPISQTPFSGAAAEAAQALLLRQQAAKLLIRKTIQQLTSGKAFDAKLTQHIRTEGRNAVGVGRYEQAGGNTGRVSMDMRIPTSNGECLLQQVCDGRLAWTREQIGDSIRLRRVDVARLDELVVGAKTEIKPRLRVGGLVELLEKAHADFALQQVTGELEGEPVWMLKGDIRPETEAAILKAAEREDWPPLCPRSVAIAIAAENNESGFGQGLPIRFEFWSDTEGKDRRLISYLRIYDLRAIPPAPETHFRFETGGGDVNYVNDTQRYLDHFGIQVTERQKRILTR